MASIHTQAEAGVSVPCIAPTRSHLWLSDDQDDQDAAVFGCLVCPVLEACRSYVEQFPEPSGVWAGRRNRKAAS